MANLKSGQPKLSQPPIIWFRISGALRIIFLETQPGDIQVAGKINNRDIGGLRCDPLAHSWSFPGRQSDYGARYRRAANEE
jgi:hypothetical protein